MSRLKKMPQIVGTEAEEEISLSLAGSDDLGAGFQIIRWGCIGSKAAFAFPKSKRHFFLHHFGAEELQDIISSLMAIYDAIEAVKTGDEHVIAKYFFDEVEPDEIPRSEMH
jgi:hypothetical protein